jgi:hypothetical protein
VIRGPSRRAVGIGSRGGNIDRRPTDFLGPEWRSSGAASPHNGPAGVPPLGGSSMRHRLSLLACAALLGAAVAFPLGVLASHQFSDVPTSSTFHEHIAAIRDAGVTTGCGINLYCPKDFVTREQMAAFLNRLGALGPGTTPVVNAETAEAADHATTAGHATTADSAADATNAGKLDGYDSSDFALLAEVREGTYNCAGHTLISANPDFDHGTSNNVVWLETAGAAAFYCPLLLPQGATITRLQVGIYDASATGGTTCQLVSYPNLVHAGGFQMGYLETTAMETPGNVVREDATIEEGLIDNDNRTYSVHCTVYGPGGVLNNALAGTSVTYESSGIPID